MEPFLQSACTCTVSWVVSELPRLRFWHSDEKTAEIDARLGEDGDWNVRATVLFSIQSSVWRSDVMQVVARYTEDRSVDVRHVAVETLSGAAGERCPKRDQIGVTVSGRWFGVSRGDKRMCRGTRSQRLWVPQLDVQYSG